MKIIGALIIFFSSFMIAAGIVEKIDVTQRSVSALRGILEHTKNMIECYSLPAGEILKRIDSSLLSDCGCFEEKIPRDFSELAERAKIEDGEACEIFSAFSKDFGKSYRQDEILRCSLYLEKMRAREQKLTKEYAKKKKVIFTVALCSALAVIILII